MKRILFLFLFSCFLSACSSSESINVSQVEHYSGGQRIGDSVSFFWYTERDSTPYVASDEVNSGHDGQYQTSYRWRQGKLQEIMRKGVQRGAQGQLVPFSTQLRFSQNGDAVFQRYRRDGQVLPIQQEQILHYEDQASKIATLTKQQRRTGIRLIQGVWNGKHFDSCQNTKYSAIEFNQTLPSFVIRRLSSLDNYLAVLGRVKGSTLYIDELLVLANDDHGCVTAPDLHEE